MYTKKIAKMTITPQSIPAMEMKYSSEAYRARIFIFSALFALISPMSGNAVDVEHIDAGAIEIIAPPATPSVNVFGYAQPIRGCFEGVVYALEPGADKLPDWEFIDPISRVYACEWNIPTRKWEMGFPGVEDHFEWFAIKYSGSFEVEEAGEYMFRISSDDGARLIIDGEVVIDNDGIHPPRSKGGVITLSAGDHDLELQYFQGPRYHINLELFVTPPGGEEGIFSVR